MLVGVNSSGTVYDFYNLIASDNTTIVRNGTGYFISANTGTSSSSAVYAATGNKYVVMDFAADLTNEFRLVQVLEDDFNHVEPPTLIPRLGVSFLRSRYSRSGPDSQWII